MVRNVRLVLLGIGQVYRMQHGYSCTLPAQIPQGYTQSRHSCELHNRRHDCRFFAISANLPTQEHLSISRPYVLQQIDFFRTLALIYGSVACYRN